MELSENFDYESVEEVLAEAEIEASASELQGMLCGMLTGGLKLNQGNWTNELYEMISESGDVSAEVSNIIEALSQWTDKEMNDSDTLAPLLLPDDNYPTVDQLEAVIVWCQGFLLGFGLQVGDSPVDNEEVKEALTDLADISQLAVEADDDEETVGALSTVIEHIRVAVQVIYWEIVVKSRASVTESTPSNQTIH